MRCFDPQQRIFLRINKLVKRSVRDRWRDDGISQKSISEKIFLNVGPDAFPLMRFSLICLAPFLFCTILLQHSQSAKETYTKLVFLWLGWGLARASWRTQEKGADSFALLLPISSRKSFPHFPFSSLSLCFPPAFLIREEKEEEDGWV